jgi:pRiA4b ORF-3-like protein
MARAWLQIKVELLGGRDIECDPPPGRIFIVGPEHTFGDLAEAIDAAFARWDLAHLHGFDLPDERRIGILHPDLEGDWLDESALKVTRELEPGEAFSYTFDFGDDWRHRCTVQPEKADPLEEYGSAPAFPVAIWGWGSIPDQYGRSTLAG